MTTATAHEAPAPWHVRHEARWRHERAALEATGWRYKVTKATTDVSLVVHYPLDADHVVRLRCTFPSSYPWFPPTVLDLDGVFGNSRHYGPGTGELCLIHDSDWNSDLTLVALLNSQLPRLIAAADGQATLPLGVELPVPHPVNSTLMVNRHYAIVVGERQMPPAGVDQGALLCRFSQDRGELLAGVVELVLGPGFRLPIDLPDHQLAPFTVAGRWTRDPGYRPGQSAASAWARISQRLAPLEVNSEGTAPLIPPEQVEVIALLVRDELAYGHTGESWVLLMRTPSPSTKRRRTFYVRAQHISRNLLAERTPMARALAHKSAVVVGLGSIGMPLAQDLAQTGVGRLTVIDPDFGDVATAGRQEAALLGAGAPKARLAEVLIKHVAPYCDMTAVIGKVEEMWEPASNASRPDIARHVRRAVADAWSSTRPRTPPSRDCCPHYSRQAFPRPPGPPPAGVASSACRPNTPAAGHASNTTGPTTRSLSRPPTPTAGSHRPAARR